MTSKQFTPWRRDMQLGALMMIIAIGAVFILVRTQLVSPLKYGPAAVLVAVFGYWRAQRGYHRWFGKYTEERSLNALEARLPAGWEMRRNVMTANGDCDAVITAPDFRFVIEIKSVRSVTMSHRLLRGTTLSFGRDVSATPASHVAQIAFNAGNAGGVGILWYPLARKKDYGLLGGTWVVTGHAKVLVKVMQKHIKRAA